MWDGGRGEREGGNKLVTRVRVLTIVSEDSFAGGMEGQVSQDEQTMNLSHW